MNDSNAAFCYDVSQVTESIGNMMIDASGGKDTIAPRGVKMRERTKIPIHQTVPEKLVFSRDLLFGSVGSCVHQLLYVINIHLTAQ